MGIKESADTWVRGKPAQAMILIGAVGLVIGAVIGLGAGFKIEQNRTRADVKRLQTQIKTGVATGSSTKVGKLVGRVTAVSGGTLSVATNQRGSEELKTSSTTRFEQAVSGTTADIAVGRRVLVTNTGHDVIVMAATSQLGRVVSKVAAKNFSLPATKQDKAITIPLDTVSNVQKVSTGTLAAIKTGAKVLAGGRLAGKGVFGAVEVILLPASSTLVTS